MLRCSYGARLCPLFCGALAYADNISLVSPTVYGMQRMLNVCSVVAKEEGLVFNGKKSVATVFIWKRRLSVFDPELRLDG